MTESGLRFLAEWVLCHELAGLSDAETAIVLRHGDPANGVGDLPHGPASDSALLNALQPEGAPEDKRALAAAFVAMFTAAPERAPIHRLRDRGAQSARWATGVTLAVAVGRLLSLTAYLRVLDPTRRAEAARAVRHARMLVCSQPANAPGVPALRSARALL